MTKCFLKSKIRELEREIMNGRQAARMAAKRIEELEHYNRRCKLDITAYNIVIDRLIMGMTACNWCDEWPDCQKAEAKDNTSLGCDEWMLKDVTAEEVKEGEPDYSDHDSDSADYNPWRVTGVVGTGERDMGSVQS